MNNLIFVSSVEDRNIKLEFSLSEETDFPRDIFLFENTGSGLGEYQTVCSLTDYQRFQTATPGVNVPVFGNKFLKSTRGVLILPMDYSLEAAKAKIRKDVIDFRLAFTNQGTTTTIVSLDND